MEHDDSNKSRYTHVHMHDHDHIREDGNDNKVNQASIAKDLALLKYMLEHNKQHAHELADSGDRFNQAGLSQTAQLISEAVLFFDLANEQLAAAIGQIGGNQ